MKKKSILKKHSAAVQITNHITLFERKLWNVLLANAYDRLLTEEAHSISVADLGEYLSYDSNDYEFVRGALNTLATTLVQWNFLAKDTKAEWDVDKSRGGAPLLAGWEDRGRGVIEYSFSPQFKKLLYHPRVYVRISLSLQNTFHDKHGFALYELFADYYDATKKYGETPEIAIDRFRALLGIQQQEYPEFKKLNQMVIKKALHEIHQRSHLRVQPHYFKSGRAVSAVKFSITEAPNSLELLNNTVQEEPSAQKKGVPKQRTSQLMTFTTLPLGSVYRLLGGAETLFIKVSDYEARRADSTKIFTMVNCDVAVLPERI